MSNGNGNFRGVPKTPATVQSDEESSSSDSSTVIENDSSTTPKKHISASVSMFEFQGPVTGKNIVQFKCLLGCIPPKTISSATYSRGNLKRHVKQKNRSRLNEFIQECKNLDCLKGLPNNTLTVSSEKSKSFIQTEISFDENYNHNRHLPQSVIDSAILDYLIEDVLPMYTVEKKGF